MLPSWSCKVVYILHRLQINRLELAKEAGISTRYLGKLLNMEEPPFSSKEKVDAALGRVLGKRGLRIEEVFVP